MSRRTDDLFLHEQVLLLALKDEKGTFYSRMYRPALGGAILAELLLNHRVEVEEGKKSWVNVVDRSRLGEPVLDEALTKIVTAKRRAQAKSWVQRFSRMSKLQHRVATQLCRRGVLKQDEEQILLLFRRRIYPELNPIPERKLIERLRRAIFRDDSNLDSRTVVLVALAQAADLLSIPFEKRRLKTRKKRIKSITEGNVLGKATREAVQAAQAAVAVAVLIPVVASAGN